MKKKIVLLPVISFLAYALLCGNAGGPGDVSSVELTGVTGTASCGGAGCHSTTPDANVIVNMELIGPSGNAVTSYTPGINYFIRIAGFNASTTANLPDFGFQVSAVKTGTATNAGYMTAPLAFVTHMTYPASIDVVEHATRLPATSGTGAPGSTAYVMRIPWNAPTAGTGSVTLRGILNAVNNDLLNTGDVWGNNSLVLTEGAAAPPGISGPSVACLGNYIMLTDPAFGGVWSSSNPAVGTVSTSGVVSGLTVGTTVISYAHGAGTDTHVLSVNPSPPQPSGATSVCPGGSTTLSSMPGGTWSSSNPAVATISSTGVVNGLTVGLTSITYNMLTFGCYSNVTITVNPVAGLSGGGTAICAGSTTTLSHATGGGAWSSGTPAVATVSGGVVTGVSGGTATISYTVGTGGCVATKVITVNGVPDASVTGGTTVCVAHTTTLTGSPTGGTWTSLNTAKATVGASTGIVTGVATGTVTIKYKVVNSCGADSATQNMNVVPAASCPTGMTITPAQEEGLRILPNPSKGNFVIRVNTPNNELANLVMTDMTGRIIKRLSTPTNSDTNVTLDVSSGIYFAIAYVGPQRYVMKIEVR